MIQKATKWMLSPYSQKHARYAGSQKRKWISRVNRISVMNAQKYSEESAT